MRSGFYGFQPARLDALFCSTCPGDACPGGQRAIEEGAPRTGFMYLRGARPGVKVWHRECARDDVDIAPYLDLTR